MRARYYNPAINQFINEDPIKDGLNWYGYVNGNPISFVDPEGLISHNLQSDGGGGRGLLEGNGKIRSASKEGITFIKNEELGMEYARGYDLLAEKNGEEVGIYAYYLGDGVITAGYGLAIGKGYLKNDKIDLESELILKLNLSGKETNVTSGGKFPRRVPGAGYLTFAEADTYFDEARTIIYEPVLNAFLDRHDISLKQHQYDALLSLTYNTSAWTYPENTYYDFVQLLIKGKDGNHDVEAIRYNLTYTWSSNPGRRAREGDLFADGY